MTHSSTPARVLGFPAPPPLSLYVHLPWCIQKCPYCDFNSHAHGGPLPERRYVDALLADLERELPWVWGRRVRSVFIGGGTPSLFSPEAVDRVLRGVAARLALVPDAEITLEANPGAVDAGRFRGYVAAGVNRLSIGVQSFEDRLLERIGRVHDGRTAADAVAAATASGASRVNLDLMFGLPGQTRFEARNDVAQACALGVGHVSYYQLTLEPNTAFYRSPPTLPDHDRVYEMQNDGLALLAEAGHRRYEVSAFAREGERCQHNLNYWQFGDYLGIGAGAHAKLTLAGEGRVVRRVKHRSPLAYMDRALGGDPVLRTSELSVTDRMFEFLLNALRLDEGFSYRLFEERTGIAREHLLAAVSRSMEDGLIERGGEQVRATEHGARFLDELLTRLLPETTHH